LQKEGEELEAQNKQLLEDIEKGEKEETISGNLFKMKAEKAEKSNLVKD
jgi:hypothetical protein